MNSHFNKTLLNSKAAHEAIDPIMARIGQRITQSMIKEPSVFGECTSVMLRIRHNLHPALKFRSSVLATYYHSRIDSLFLFVSMLHLLRPDSALVVSN